MDSSQQKTRRIQVTVTENCYRVIKQYAALKGLTMSDALFMALNQDIHREALEEPDVRRIFERNGVEICPEIKREWRNNRALQQQVEVVL